MHIIYFFYFYFLYALFGFPLKSSNLASIEIVLTFVVYLIFLHYCCKFIVFHLIWILLS